MPKNQLPPVPPAGRARKVPGERRRRQPAAERDDARSPAGGAKIGEAQNVTVNTTNQGYQQDR